MVGGEEMDEGIRPGIMGGVPAVDGKGVDGPCEYAMSVCEMRWKEDKTIKQS